MSDVIGFYLDPDADSNTKTHNMNVALSEPHIEQIEDAAEELDMSSRSEAYRYFLTLGMRAMIETDPRNSTSSDGGYDSLTLRDILPDSKEEALNLREGEVVEKFDEVLAEEIDNDPKIEMEGWKVWTTK